MSIAEEKTIAESKTIVRQRLEIEAAVEHLSGHLDWCKQIAVDNAEVRLGYMYRLVQDTIEYLKAGAMAELGGEHVTDLCTSSEIGHDIHLAWQASQNRPMLADLIKAMAVLIRTVRKAEGQGTGVYALESATKAINEVERAIESKYIDVPF